ncbi:MAG: glycosyltransferase family 2 protein [Acidobacteriota bacterium]|nr:glycosyltransferase family 2 protein [Acidobacteriota bacterium]
MKLSVIFSVYNSPDWMEHVIWGYAAQTEKDFEIVIADDGSTPETRQRIDMLRERTGLQITHVWQEDNGFQKTRILNKAILATRGDYLLFSDGDCIPRNDFVATHLTYREPGYFLSGGYFKLPMKTSEAVSTEDILNGNVFRLDWLRNNGLPLSPKVLKLTARGFWSKLLNGMTTTRATWNGHNASGWKADIVAANGFDNRMQYGGEDRELGERLFNKGIRSKQIRYSAVVVHLDHSRGYVSEEAWRRNDEIRAITRKERRTVTPDGLAQLDNQTSPVE